MNENKPDFEAALETVLESSRGEADHITPDLLVAYHHERLSPEESDAVQEHLAACRSCGDLLLELARFGEGADATSEVADFQAEAEWRTLRPRLSGTEPGAAPSISRPLVYALAASLLAAVGLAAWVVVLKNDLDASRRPQVNLAVVYLEPDGMTRGDPREATVKSSSERFLVILNPPSYPAAVEHRVEILDDEGRRLWSGAGLLPTETGDFHVELSRRFLLPGDYRVHLSLGDELLAEYELRIAP